MLRAVHGNRVESLLEALLGALPPADPFAPATIAGIGLVMAPTAWVMAGKASQ